MKIGDLTVTVERDKTQRLVFRVATTILNVYTVTTPQALRGLAAGLIEQAARFETDKEAV